MNRQFLYLILFLLAGLYSNALAQNVVNIERFREARGVTLDGEPVRKLYDARLSTGNTTLVCDSAWQFINRNEIRAYGNIQIETPTETIWTDTLYYFTNRDLSYLRGRTIIMRDSTTLFGESVDYNFLTKVAHFRDGIRLEDEDGILIAQTGTYIQNQDSAVFRGRVQLSDSAQYAEGDSLFINRETNNLQLYSNIFVADSASNTVLTGEYLEADSTGYRYVRDNAYLRRVSSDTTDTTHINAEEILLLEQDSVNLIRAYGKVKVWSPKFSSLSDTLLYNSGTERFQLISNPRAWHENIQLTGPYISVQMDSNDVKELRSHPKPVAVQRDSVTGRLNQILGDTLIAHFSEGELARILIYPNSEVLYHTKDGEGNPDGAVEYSSPKTTMYFKNGDLSRVVAGQNQGMFLSEYGKLKDRRLGRFAWNPGQRPQKPVEEVTPKWPPVPKNRPFELPRRYVDFVSSM